VGGGREGGTSERNFSSSLSQSIARITPTESDSATDKRIPARVNGVSHLSGARRPLRHEDRFFRVLSLSLSLSLFRCGRRADRNVPMYYFSSAPHRRRSRYRANCKLKTEPGNFERAWRAPFPPMRPPPRRRRFSSPRTGARKAARRIVYLYSQRRLLTVVGG